MGGLIGVPLMSAILTSALLKVALKSRVRLKPLY